MNNKWYSELTDNNKGSTPIRNNCTRLTLYLRLYFCLTNPFAPFLLLSAGAAKVSCIWNCLEPKTINTSWARTAVYLTACQKSSTSTPAASCQSKEPSTCPSSTLWPYGHYSPPVTLHHRTNDVALQKCCVDALEHVIWPKTDGYSLSLWQPVSHHHS